MIQQKDPFVDPPSFWGLFWAAISGAVLGLCSQLYYLSYISFDHPAMRLWLSPIAGALGAAIFVMAAAYITSKLTKLSFNSAGKLAGWALLGTCALLVPFWHSIASSETYWLFPAAWAFAAIILFPFVRPQRKPIGAKKLQSIIPLLTGAVVLLGLLLRLSGVNFGLPDMIAHCDTPKQLQLLHYFMQGNLIPPNFYPVGHIYLFAGLIKLFWYLAPLAGQPPLLIMGNVPDSANLVLAAHTIGAFLGAAIPLIGFFAARRLWGAWAGLCAALLLALDPIHLTYSRQAMGEVTQTFWVALSFLFSVRLLQEKRWWDCILAGIFAGLAVATKIYGGYILAAGFAAWLLSSPWRIWLPLLLAASAALGVFIGTPYAWIDPYGWLKNISVMSAEQFDAGFWQAIWPGLQYSFSGLLHRFHLPWLLAAAASLVFLFKRRRKEDLLFLVPASFSIVFIYVLRLRYLREWDFVNLTVYLNLALAAGLGPLLAWSWQRKGWNKLAPVLVGLFLVMQSWTALSDAWVARVEDDRRSAESWLACLTRPGERIATEMGFSGAYTDWCVVNGPGFEANGTGAELRQGRVPKNADAIVLEEGWSAEDLPQNNIKPLMNIQVRHTYWEHPRVAIYRPDSPGYNGKVVLPLFRADQRRFAFWNTDFSRSLPAELLNKPTSRELTVFAQEEPIGGVGYLALGKGSGRLRLGPGLSIGLESKQESLTAGMAYLLRSPVPLMPRTYQVSLDWQGEAPAWAGVFPRPEGMLPMLLRLEAWQQINAVAPQAWWESNCPEAGLIWAASLAREGRREEAALAVNEVKSRAPGFVGLYKALGHSAGPDLLYNLAALTGLGPGVLTWRSVVWPRETGWWGEKCQPGIDPDEQERLERKHHIWLSQEFLPGFVRLRARLGWERPAEAGKAFLKLVAHRPGVLVADIAKTEIEQGLSEVELYGRIAAGPVRLEVVLESQAAAGPRLQRVELLPDLSAEFAWRWQTLEKHLGEMLN